MTSSLNQFKFWNKKSLTITSQDPTYKVVYLGNVLCALAKGQQAVEKPLETLWTNYCTHVKTDIQMKLTVCNNGLKAMTKEHGLTQYWANRVTFSCVHNSYPKIFCWIYRHDGRKGKPELRCHAVLCANKDLAQVMMMMLHVLDIDVLAESESLQLDLISVESILVATKPIIVIVRPLL